MVYNFFTSVLFLFFSFSTTAPKTITTARTAAVVASVDKAEAVTAESLYENIKANSASVPAFTCFSTAIKGFNRLKQEGKIEKDLLTVIDFSKSSNTKRLWIIDMATQTVLYNTLVAHGRNSGNEFANQFSNDPNSNKSSLGFYATGEIYTGKHGESLRLDGLEKGINSNARARAVVMHAADYVCQDFIRQHARLGRSLGCPALPNKLNKEIIHLIEGKSCLFIYHPTKKYAASSKLLAS
ncbi:murein L,D-transpeptidase catalytic domain family protein [Flavobacterium rhizosphaerae]|uniref:Murein L,D-transpeptidase catalytic domain family protein n=1 Tax=Flavobacterium rhizosphaerae TaxID=3163298 RepID=A0ABW8YZH5_9FLAO